MGGTDKDQHPGHDTTVGFMHSPAIGLLTGALILDGRESSMNIEALPLSRFARGRVAAEANTV